MGLYQLSFAIVAILELKLQYNYPGGVHWTKHPSVENLNMLTFHVQRIQKEIRTLASYLLNAGNWGLRPRRRTIYVFT